MGAEDTAAVLFQKAYRTKSLTSSEAAEARRVRASNESSDNIVAMTSGALHHAGRETFNPWDETWREWGSRMYDWWTCAVICSIPEWQHVCAAYGAYHSLLTGDFDKIVVDTGGAKFRHDRNYGLNGWRGATAQPAASRCLKRLDSHPYPERHVGGRIVEGGVLNDHSEIGWASKIIQENLARFRYTDPVAALDAFRVRGGQWFRVYRWPNGDRFSICGRSTHHTRGPIGASLISGGVITLYTTSRPTSGGEWSQVIGRVEGNRWSLESGTASMGGEIAPGARVIIWDESGARVDGDDEPLPAPIEPELTQAGLLYDSALRQLGDQGYIDREDRGRTCFEVMDRICRKPKAEARQGVETLLADMKRNGW